MLLSEMIDKIHNELALVYVGGAIDFIDENYDKAWTKAIDRFDAALGTKDINIMQLEGDIYLNTVLRLIDIYKMRTRTNKADSFIDKLFSKEGS